jgi:hypothetical protein
MARPKKPVDAEKVEKLAGMGLSAELIGAFMDVSHHTIERRFGPTLKRGREKRNARLQIKLYQEAMATPCNTAIAIFLAKNWLGYCDRPDVTVNIQQNTVMPTRIIGLPAAELEKLVGDQYKQL